VGTIYYYVVVSSGGSGCSSVSSNAVAVVINTPPTIISQPVSVNECVGGTDQMSISATIGSGGLTYQWYVNTVNSYSGSTSLVGETNTLLTIPSASLGTYYYYVSVSGEGSGCTSILSNIAVATINSAPSILTQPGSISECVNGSDQLSVVPSAGLPSLTYQWYSNSLNSNVGGTLINGATSSSYLVPSSSAGTYYYYVVIGTSGSGCTSITSSVSTVTINGLPSIVTQPASINECIGGTDQISVVAAGGVSSLTYQWYSNVSNSSLGGTLISGATNSSYTIPSSIAGTTYYYVMVSSIGSGCNSVISNVAAGNINPQLSITTHPANTAYCSGGGTYTPFITVVGGLTPVYQWQYSADNILWNNVIDGTPSNSLYSNGYSTSSSIFFVEGNIPDGTYYYRCNVTSSGSGCSSIASNPGVLTIYANNQATTSWTGALDTDWFNSNNWSNCIPGPNTVTTIPDLGTSANYPIINGSQANVYNITIQGSGTVQRLTIGTGSIRVWQ
jgi:fibronectin type 3 domain-containing protein